MAHTIKAVLAWTLAVASTAAAGAPITFDFESEPATLGGAYVVRALTQGGLTMTLRRQGGTAFDIEAAVPAAPYPPGFGVRQLTPFAVNVGAPFVASFSAPINSFSIAYGDFGSDADTLTLQAYSGLDGTGTLLASAFDNYGINAFPVFDTVTVAAAGIRSVVFIGGGPPFTHSVYYDNIVVDTVAAVPEPPTALLLALAGALLVGGRRRTRVSQARGPWSSPASPRRAPSRR